MLIKDLKFYLSFSKGAFQGIITTRMLYASKVAIR